MTSNIINQIKYCKRTVESNHICSSVFTLPHLTICDLDSRQQCYSDNLFHGKTNTLNTICLDLHSLQSSPKSAQLETWKHEVAATQLYFYSGSSHV